MGIPSKYGSFYSPATNKPISVGQKLHKRYGTIIGWCGAEMTPRKFGEMSRSRYRRGKVRRRY